MQKKGDSRGQSAHHGLSSVVSGWVAAFERRARRIAFSPYSCIMSKRCQREETEVLESSDSWKEVIYLKKLDTRQINKSIFLGFVDVTYLVL